MEETMLMIELGIKPCRDPLENSFGYYHMELSTCAFLYNLFELIPYRYDLQLASNHQCYELP